MTDELATEREKVKILTEALELLGSNKWATMHPNNGPSCPAWVGVDTPYAIAHNALEKAAKLNRPYNRVSRMGENS